MEFEIKTDLTFPAKIEFNFEEIKAELSEKLTTYNALVVTAEGIKEAKADKAKLNKLRIAVEDKRKEIKKLCLAPYESFEAQCKEIVALIDEPIKSIDGQIAVFDQKMQDEKWKQIEGYYKAEVKDLINLVPLEKIVSPKWKNKTESIETICYGIGDTLDRIRNEIAVIENLHSDFGQQLIDFYLENYNLTQTLQEHERLKIQHKNLEARVAQSVVKPETVPSPIPEQLYNATFRVVGTKEQIQALGAFMKSNDINYEVIK